MLAIGRLWRRAPGWRFCLFLAVASTGLLAMFPPKVPTLDRWRAAPAGSGAHYRPQPDPPPLTYGSIDLPPITQTRSGLIPFAGRQVPLPEGRWSELVLLRSGGPQMLQAVLLVRLQSARMTGMIVVAGPPAVAPAQMPAMQINQCLNLAGLPMHDLSPADDLGGARQECWSVRRLLTAHLTEPDRPDPLDQKAFARLGKLEIEVPAHLLASRYFRRDGNSELSVTVMLPDPAESSTVMRRTEAWMQRWVLLLHRGFDGALKPSNVTTSLARDPAVLQGSRQSPSP
jgi:hypothetical protein